MAKSEARIRNDQSICSCHAAMEEPAEMIAQKSGKNARCGSMGKVYFFGCLEYRAPKYQKTIVQHPS